MLHRLLTLVLAPALLGACSAHDPATPAPQLAAPPAPQGPAPQGVVSAADARATQAGVAMLRAGGSATDAAIATMLALTVVEPQSSGIGGGGFLLHAQADGTIITLDGRETAPAAANPQWFLDGDGAPLPFTQAVLSGLSVGVPGNIALAEELHRRHGRLPWEQLFQPAIALARDGFVITERLRDFLERAKNRATLEDESRALFFDEAGEPLPVGTHVRNPALADTLEQLAAGGAQAFYQGEHARLIAERVASATPHEQAMTAEDIAAYRVKERPPVCASYRRHRICGMGPPSSGATTVLAILKQLEPFDLATLGPRSPTAWHLFAESQRLAYADRDMFLADSDFVHVPLHGLMSEAYLARRSALISAERAMEAVAAGSPPPGDAPLIMSRAPGYGPQEQGTSHFSVADRWGNAVTYTSTIEGPFGSGLMVGGYYLNNELTDFSFLPERDGAPVANQVEGGKRPRSSMAPTLVFDEQGQLVLAIGAAGGATIPVQVAKALIGYLDWGLSAEDAIALPGLYSPGDTVFVEPGTWLEELLPALESLGHREPAARRMPFKANAVEWRDGRWLGAADPRSEGTALAE